MARIFHLSLVVLGMSAVISSCSMLHKNKKQASLPGTWQAQPIVIDGDSKDWPSPYPNYDPNSLVAYATSNDKYNLYVTMETGDELVQMKILKRGMIVSIDTGGKKDPQLHINYPLENDNDPLDLMKDDNGTKSSYHSKHIDRQFEGKIDKNLREATQFSTEGFNKCNGGYLISQTTPCGIKIRAKIDEYKELVWEAVIPFKAIYGIDSISEKEAGKPISVCFAVKAFKNPGSKPAENNSGMNNNMSAGAGGRGGGMRGGGGGGGGRSRSQSEDPMQHLYENTKTWKQFGIAYQR